jgi:PhzF family phenazine biosynthesis protein
MEIPYYQVDAFAERLFQGNPAGVCPLDAWLPDEIMQAIAAENNLSETAFFVPRGAEYELRWYTPTMEVDLCGHATLASAFVIFNRLGGADDLVRFHSRSGPLQVSRDGELLSLDFPARPAEPRADLGDVAGALGAPPQEVLAAASALAVFAGEAEVRGLAPDMGRLMTLECDGVIATAPGEDCDFVSRYFAPRAGIPEDPVTGSAHCTLTPYWSERLGKKRLTARQISARGGELRCEDLGARTRVSGRAVIYFEGVLSI